MAVGSTQPVTEMRTRNISWGGRGRAGRKGQGLRLTTIQPSCADCLEIWSPQTPGTLQAAIGLYRDCLTFTLSTENENMNIPYTTAFPYGNGMVLHFYQQQESSTTKTVHKVINKGLKTYV